MRRLTITAIAVALAWTTGPRAQQQPTFRAGTQTVPVYATVLDKSGRLVLDL